MEVCILGAHHMESSSTRLVSLLVDGRLAVDAGSLTTALSFPQQQEVEAVAREPGATITLGIEGMRLQV